MTRSQLSSDRFAFLNTTMTQRLFFESRKRLAAKHDGPLGFSSITVARLYKICLRTAQLFTESAGNGILKRCLRTTALV
jgi:hypothetical protein